MNEYDSIILSYYDSLIHQSDLELLKEGQWLNDRIIGFVYEYFEIEIFNAECSDYLFSFLNPSTVQYLKLSNSIEEAKMCFLEPLELNRKDYLFLPLNNNRTTEAGGCHWSLMVIDKKRSILKHCDSIGSNENEALSFFEKYKTHFGLEKFETEINFPKQTNSVDCGAYVLGKIICCWIQYNNLIYTNDSFKL